MPGFSKLLLFLVLMPVLASAQLLNSLVGDESVLNAQTKQVNQFFRRFNGEEDTRGQRYYPKDKEYRNAQLRRNYLGMLFDQQNASMTDPLRDEFVNSVLDANQPQFLDFHSGQWFAEVNTKFLYQGKEENLLLFLKLEKENLGHKWVITNVYFRHFHQMFGGLDESSGTHFLHPLSHELDFMNLLRVFKDKKYVEYYTQKEYQPDYLTLFLYEFKKGGLKYKSVTNVKFHFFQINGWYFELADFNRPGNNSGWLISGLMKIDEDKKDMLLKYIYHE